MKRIILLIAIVVSIDVAFPQYIILHKNVGVGQNSKLSEIDSITFCQATVTYSGKIYNVVAIGGQCWLKENLDIGTRINGSLNQTNNGGTNIIEKYCYGDLDANCNTYGGLYQWNEAMQYVTTAGAQGICPTGWHIPTRREFTELKFLAVSSNGNALKAVGQGTGAGTGTNTSGFSALLAGYRNDNGTFGSLGVSTDFWSSTEYSATGAYYLNLRNDDSNINLLFVYKGFGFNVRCLKD